MTSKTRLLLVAALAAAAAAFRKRPVKPPADTGSWQPADSSHSRR